MTMGAVLQLRLVVAWLLLRRGAVSGEGGLVAFAVSTNSFGLKPALVALLRVRVYYPEAGLFVVGGGGDTTGGDFSAVCKRLPRDATTGPWWQVDQTSPCEVNARSLRRAKEEFGVETLVVDHPLIDLIVKLRYENGEINTHYKTPWPPHCYMPMVVPELLHARGYEYTVTIDYDVFAADGRLLEELPKVAGIGMIRVYPKECWDADAPERCERDASRADGARDAEELRIGYPAFYDNASRAALARDAPEGFAFRDGTNYGMLVFNNALMADKGWAAWCMKVVAASRGYMSGGQDLINLAIGRSDVPVHYLPARFNVQLAFPAERDNGPVSRGWMGAPYCAYGFAPVLAAAAGAASGDRAQAYEHVSMAHFVWLDKPWYGNVKLNVAAMHGNVKYLFHKPWIVVMTGFWWNEWRAFTNTTFLAKEFNPLVLETLNHPNTYVSLERAEPCIAPDAVACAKPRSAKDEPFPDGWDLTRVHESNARKAP